MTTESGLSKPILKAVYAAVAALMITTTVNANHTVLVEGEQDFDGDGLLGAQEDNDGDQVFGTINGGVGGVKDNGRVLIVTSGRFFESITLSGNGVTALEAAPGVSAIVEAFNGGGDMSLNNARQKTFGILVDTDGSFPIEIRNLVSRNWTAGIEVRGSSRVTIDNVKLDSNVNYGVQIKGDSRVSITNSQISGTGYRKSGSLGATPGGDIQPSPGIGIEYEDYSRGYVSNTTVTHSFAAGIKGNSNVSVENNTVFNNNPNLIGVVTPTTKTCIDSDGDGYGWDGSATCIP